MEKNDTDSKFVIGVDRLLEHITKGLERTNTLNTLSDVAYQFTKSGFQELLNRRNHLRIEGESNIPAEGGFVLASNHQSWLDVFSLGAACPRRLHFVAKAAFQRWPILRHGIRFAGSVFVNRKGDGEALAQIVQELQNGKAVAIFPEGTIPGEEDIPRRNRDGRTGLLPGKTGAVRLAIRSGVPIIPVGISGTEKTLPPEVWPRMELLRLPPSSPITIRFGSPISYGDYQMDSLDNNKLHRLTNNLMDKISALVDHRSNFAPLVVPAPPRQVHEKIGVLFLHGFTSELRSIDAIVPHLKAAGIPYRAPILRGHGTRYQDLVGVRARDWYVDAERALIDLWNTVDKVIVVGISMGGLVAIELGVRHPDKIAGIVTGAAALKFQDPLARFSGRLASAVKFWPSPDQFTDESLRIGKTNYQKFPLETFASLYEYSLNVKELLPLLHIPIRILHSKNDSVISPVSANIIYSTVSSRIRELVWYKETNHSILEDMEAQTVIKDIIDFVVSFRKEPDETEY